MSGKHKVVLFIVPGNTVQLDRIPLGTLRIDRPSIVTSGSISTFELDPTVL